jgi:hypothetical protein
MDSHLDVPTAMRPMTVPFPFAYPHDNGNFVVHDAT